MSLRNENGAFKSIGDLMPFKVEQKVIKDWHACEGCGMSIQLLESVTVFGPKKGEKFIQAFPICHCESLKIFKAQQEKHREEMRQKKKESAIRLFEEKSTINTKLINARFDNYKPPTDNLANAKIQAIEWTRNLNVKNPRNLIFFGDYGTGKSHLAVSISHEVMDKGHSCVFITVQKMMTMIKQTYDRNSEIKEGDLMTALESVDVLILDDIGAEQLTEWGRPKLLDLLDTRQGRCTIYTTNLSENELEEKLGIRSVERMFFESDVIEMLGQSYRRR